MSSIPPFPTQKPKPSGFVWLLSVILIIGLAAMFLAALHAFSTVMPIYQAIFAALIIEAGMIVDAIALIRGRNWIAAVGLGLSLIVSARYNYVQVYMAAGNVLDQFSLYTLALGPLFALSFLALAIGKQLAIYDSHVVKWQYDERAWVEKWQGRAIRAEEKRQLATAYQQVAEGNLPQLSGNLPASLPKPKDWRLLTQEQKEAVYRATVQEVAYEYNLSIRTARNWKYAADEMFKENKE